MTLKVKEEPSIVESFWKVKFNNINTSIVIDIIRE